MTILRAIIHPGFGNQPKVQKISMPVYTYHCDRCGVQFEMRQKFSDDPLTKCPECNQKALRKVYQPVGIVFKGSGFYSTDNRSASGAKRVGKKSDSDEKPSSTEEKSEKKTKEQNDE